MLKLSAKDMHTVAQLLFGMQGKPVLRRSAWNSFTKDVESLGIVMEKYSAHLKQQAAETKSRQSLDYVVRPLSQFFDLKVYSGDASRVLSSEEMRLETSLNEVGEYKAIEFEDDKILGENRTSMQCHRFLQSFNLHFPVVLYRYAVGGNVGTTVFVWKTAEGLSLSELTTQPFSMIENLKPQILQYHTKQMRRSFKLQCNNRTGISPAVQHYLYSCLTDDSTASNANQRDIDYRKRLVVLGELPELCVNLCTLNTGCPNEYDTFLGILQSLIIREVTAEDEWCHGIAHLSHFISQHDLHQQAADKYPPGTPIPSIDWLALQVQQKSRQSHAALKYSGKLDVRCCVQARQLCCVHEDDHYSSALLKMQWAMAVSIRHHSSFVCLDDKAKIPVGEPAL